MPWYVLYDYVEVYKWCPEEEDFKFHWRDDFDSFDSGRWHKASGTFPANSSVFHSSNVYTEDGNLILKMEPDHEHHFVEADTEHHVDRMSSNFERQPLHAKEGIHHSKQVADDIEIPPVHDAFVDSHLFGKHVDHEDKYLVAHH